MFDKSISGRVLMDLVTRDEQEKQLKDAKERAKLRREEAKQRREQRVKAGQARLPNNGVLSFSKVDDGKHPNK